MDTKSFEKAWVDQTIYPNQDIFFTARTLSADGSFSIKEEIVKIYKCTKGKVLRAQYKNDQLWLEVSFDPNAKAGSSLAFWSVVSSNIPESTLQIKEKFRFGDRVYELQKNKDYTLSVDINTTKPDKKKLAGDEGGKETETYQNE